MAASRYSEGYNDLQNFLLCRRLTISIMKQIMWLFLISVLGACDPPRDVYDTGTIRINARVINPKPTIQLGDSVVFYFEIPDTVDLNGKNIKVSAGARDGATIGLTPYKIISSHPGGSTNDPNLRTINIYANPGTLTINETLVFDNQRGKLSARLFMIPQQRGVYYLLQSEHGFADLNNQSLKLRFIFNYGSINRNHQLLIDSAGTGSNFSLYLQDKINRNLEMYGFQVI